MRGRAKIRQHEQAARRSTQNKNGNERGRRRQKISRQHESGQSARRREQEMPQKRRSRKRSARGRADSKRLQSSVGAKPAIKSLSNLATRCRCSVATDSTLSSRNA